MSRPMAEDEVLAYVRAAAVAMELPLDDAAARRVAVQLVRTSVLARLLDDAPLGVGDEPAELFRAAPFPGDDAQ